jgi:glycosyltransferase involved in cell wall biosynthesis
MMAQWDSYQLVAPSRPLHTSAIGLDHEIDEWADPSITEYLAWIGSKRRYDVAIVNYTWMSFALEALPGSIFKIIDTHDVFSTRRALLEANGIAPEFFHTSVEGEAKGLSRADFIWAIKDSERRYFEQKLGVVDAITMLHAESDRGWWTGPPSKDGWLRAGVIGARNNVNRQNLEEFLKVALPIFEKYMAPVKIIIAGGCSDDFRDFRRPNVEVRGRVPEVEEFYRDVDVVIAPMRFSTGLKIKVSEALASGAPVIAHAHAMDGYPTFEPLHQLASFEAMARALCELAFERSPLQELAAKSREVCAEIRAAVHSAFAATRTQISKKLSETICVIAPMVALEPGSLLHDHLLAALDYIHPLAKIELFMTGPVAKPNRDLLRRYDLQHKVFLERAEWEQLGDAAPETWTPLELAECLASRGFARAYVMADCQMGLTVGLGALKLAIVRHDVIELAGGDADGTVDCLRKAVDVVVVGAASKRIQRWVGSPGVAEIVQAPFVRGGPSTRLSSAADDGDAPEIFIFSAANDLVSLELKSMCEGLGFAVGDLVLSDDATARAIVSRSREKDPLAGIGRARLIVDLAPETALSSAVGELAMRSGAPRIKFARGPQAVGFWRFPSISRPASIGRLLRTVSLALTDEATLSELRAASAQEVLSLGDAGWTVLGKLFDRDRRTSSHRGSDAVKELFW